MNRRTHVMWALTIALACCAGIATAAIGGRRHGAERERVASVGQTLPAGTVFSAPTQPEDIRSIAAAAGRSLVVVFSIGCSQCVGEAQKWIQAADRSNAVLVPVAYTAEWKAVDEFKRFSGVKGRVYLCDSSFRELLASESSPTILVVEGSRITFRADGQDATAQLEAFTKNVPTNGSGS
ncbi:MAG: hypothetical protein ABIV28_05320 [Longimicrobiales bacterium]